MRSLADRPGGRCAPPRPRSAHPGAGWAGRAPGSQAGSIGAASPDASRRGAPSGSACSRGDIADLARGRVDELPGQPMDEEPGQEQVVPDPVPDLGLVAGSNWASQSACNAATVSRTPSARNATPLTLDRAGRRFGAGRARRSRAERSPSASVTTMVRAVVRQRHDGVRRHGAAGPQGGAGLAERPPVDLGSCSAQPGCGETYGSIGTREQPTGARWVEGQRPDALGPDVESYDEARHHAAPSRQEHARVHDPVRVEPPGDIPERDPQLALPPRDRHVVAPDAVLVADVPPPATIASLAAA